MRLSGLIIVRLGLNWNRKSLNLKNILIGKFDKIKKVLYSLYIAFNYMNIKQQTQVTFISNKDLKNRTIKKVKEDGITLKALLTMAMKAYLNNELNVSLQSNNIVHDEIFSDKDVVTKSNKLGILLKKTNI